jgi:hypothetical protein
VPASASTVDVVLDVAPALKGVLLGRIITLETEGESDNNDNARESQLLSYAVMSAGDEFPATERLELATAVLFGSLRTYA